MPCTIPCIHRPARAGACAGGRASQRAGGRSTRGRACGGHAGARTLRLHVSTSKALTAGCSVLLDPSLSFSCTLPLLLGSVTSASSCASVNLWEGPAKKFEWQQVRVGRGARGPMHKG